MAHHNLRILEGRYSIHRLAPWSEVPPGLSRESFFSLTHSAEELSLVVREGFKVNSSRVEPGWRALKVEGPLDFAEVGIIAGLSKLLAEAQISLFAISTFDTDYLLVKAEQFDRARVVLAGAGHRLF